MVCALAVRSSVWCTVNTQQMVAWFINSHSGRHQISEVIRINRFPFPGYITFVCNLCKRKCDSLVRIAGIFLLYTLGTPPSPPPKSDKTLYTGIYLPTFREGTNFIIKLLVSCLGALTGPGGGPP